MLAPPAEVPALVILPGGLLGRVVARTPGGLQVDWWSELAPAGWRSFGLEGRPLPAELASSHPCHALALARILEPTA